ncbi:hypothetical protein BGX26_012402 [Mortierella sp. AD094]|nr:hypothetical protein BGX26_012402 [Mortierella sp. AD094]
MQSLGNDLIGSYIEPITLTWTSPAGTTYKLTIDVDSEAEKKLKEPENTAVAQVETIRKLKGRVDELATGMRVLRIRELHLWIYHDACWRAKKAVYRYSRYRLIGGNSRTALGRSTICTNTWTCIRFTHRTEEEPRMCPIAGMAQ